MSKTTATDNTWRIERDPVNGITRVHRYTEHERTAQRKQAANRRSAETAHAKGLHKPASPASLPFVGIFSRAQPSPFKPFK